MNTDTPKPEAPLSLAKAFLACLPIAYCVHSHYLRTAADPIVRHPWFRPALLLAAAALWILLALAARRAARRLPSWLMVSGFAASLLAVMIAGFPALIGFGAPQEMPPGGAGGYSAPGDLPRLDLIFREVRLVFWRNRSIMQGTDRYAYAVGTPTPVWCAAMKSAAVGGTEARSACDPTNLLVWAKVDCAQFGLGADHACRACEAGNWNHPKSHLATFTSDCRQAVIYSGTGPSYDKVVALAAIPARLEDEGPYRFPPARYNDDSAEAKLRALYEHLVSTAPAASAGGEIDALVLKALREGDAATLGHFRAKGMGAPIFRQGLKSTETSVREEAAVSLAQDSKDPAALPVLLDLIKRSPSPRIAQALGLYGRAAAPAVESLLFMADMQYSSDGAKDLIVPLIRIGTPEALAGLKVFLKKYDFGLSGVSQVAGAAAELGPEARAVLPQLHGWLKERRTPEEQLALIGALRKVGGPKEAAAHLAPLIAILENAADSFQATHSADLLGEIGPAAAPAAAALIKRFEANPKNGNYSSALEKIGTPEAVRALKKQYPNRY